MYEYLEEDQSTWKFQKLPDIPAEFVEKLTKIGGLNRFGQPNLRVVKGNEIYNDRSEDQKLLKYHAGWTPFEVSGYGYESEGKVIFTTRVEDIPSGTLIYPLTRQEELGLLRYVVEKWVSPEELANSHRFQQRYAVGDIAPTLRDFPREGIYDTYFIIENAAGKFKMLGADVLEYLQFRWHFERKELEEQEQVRQALLDEAEAKRKQLYEERLDAVIEGDVKLPKEELERREWYWNAVHDYAREAGRDTMSTTI
jgi:hypothetical protein